MPTAKNGDGLLKAFVDRHSLKAQCATNCKELENEVIKHFSAHNNYGMHPTGMKGSLTSKTLSSRTLKHSAANLDGGMIEIVVGTDRPVTFCVHEELLRASACFFKAALSHDWKEARSRTISLNSDEPEIFRLYMHWLYRGTLPTRIASRNAIVDNKEYLQLSKAYVLGDKLQDGHFTDAVMDAIIDKSSEMLFCPNNDMISYVYDNTTELSQLRIFLVDSYVNEQYGNDLGEPGVLPNAFVHSIAVELLKLRKAVPGKKQPRTLTSTCKYHQHASDEKVCYKYPSKTGNTAAESKKQKR